MATQERWRVRFEEYAEGVSGSRVIGREGLRACLECTDSFCLTEPWLPEHFVDQIMSQYAREEDGRHHLEYEDFLVLARDGVLLDGVLEDHERAFNKLDGDGKGWLEREQLTSLLEGLGTPLSETTLDTYLPADPSGKVHFAEFLHIAGRHLDLKDVLSYLAMLPASKDHARTAETGHAATTPDVFHAPRGQVTRVRSEASLDSVVAQGDDVIVQLAFTWCRPCKRFATTYERLAATYDTVRFVKIIGNENESTKHYGKETVQAKSSPMFVLYRGGAIVASWYGINEQKFRDHLTGHFGVVAPSHANGAL